jgi:hypothetical protein
MWDVLVRRDDLRQTELRESEPPPLGEGEARLAVESFALTSNNVTYAALGDMLRYWLFFPAPEGFGRVPVWGHAKVVESRAAAASEGLRIFGYLPMSSHVVMRFEDDGRGGLMERSAHRAKLPPTYNAYVRASGGEDEDWRSVLRPLFMTSRLLDAHLAEAGAKSAVLTSASSKTAMGLAWLLRRRGTPVTGITSARGKAQLAGKELYDQLLTYDEAASLAALRPAILVDFAGDAATVAAVHRRLADDLTQSLIVGATHWDVARPTEGLPGPQPTLFFAPDVIQRLAGSDEGRVFLGAFGDDLAAFIAANSWLRLVTHRGPEALRDLWREVVDGKGAPDVGLIVRP